MKDTDPEIYGIMQKELHRQMYGLELIPSENYVSKEVMEALGSWLTNKYSEGYPGKRYYGGNEFIDIIETIAIERAKKLFSAEWANVQPYSGSPANQAVYMAMVPLGEKVMGMELSQGGHLTHGSPVNFSGKLYKMISYGVDKETELIDYDLMLKKAKEEKPKMIIVGATAYPRTYDFRRVREICDEVGAYAFADIAHIAGLCAAGVHDNPVPYFDVVSTTTHKTLRGPRGAMIMCKAQYGPAIDKAVFPGLQGGPHDHQTAAIAVTLKEASQPSFKNYAEQIVKNARSLAEALTGYGFRLVSGGTDNHLILIDLRNKSIMGKEAQVLLDSVGITTNRNMIPYDPSTPFNPSGLRIGTPALTSRGMKESEMKEVASLINRAIENRNDEAAKKKIKEDVEALCRNFIIY
ncbi:Serine hydroxymethyltransferase [Candidatus Burarchaeum australiense]|nr:Serine hydroxymethyltransferase [Candidatus Burarchaeum australiense]